MNTIILSALSGIILMFSGFYIKNNRALNILSVVLFFGMIVGGIFDLKGCSMFAGKFDNNIVFRNVYCHLFHATVVSAVKAN